jgi:rubrerythrin
MSEKTSFSAPNYGCPGCMGGDKWPLDEDPWTCPVCDAVYWSDDDMTEDSDLFTDDAP